MKSYIPSPPPVLTQRQRALFTPLDEQDFGRYEQQPDWAAQLDPQDVMRELVPQRVLERRAS